ncbi:hypothetical protein [Streptomyces griseoruber]|uniref:Uncharacterized protein n=1 Tax=Streptomyces griseoruber TaxID=1943 RepID=A0A101SZ16_9ACTN|nr:hypothetical protein [Streptomyces griseoruber]KUN82773.1 hypothetical protein AQJ64_18735 [Streptomyces griseoruber]
MGTSLTPEFWERFAVLLVAGAGLTCVLAAWFDDLAVRLLRRRAHETPPQTPPQTPTPHRPERHRRRVPAHS